jgi:hypothetical protein
LTSTQKPATARVLAYTAAVRRFVALVVTGASLVLILAPMAVGRPLTKPNPNSPARVEYQLPLERPRADAHVPSSGAKAANSHQAELFGVGVAARQKRPSSGHRSGVNGQDATAARKPAKPRRGDDALQRVSAAGVPRTASGSDGDFLIVLVALGVLVVGLASGVLLKRLLTERNGQP